MAGRGPSWDLPGRVSPLIWTDPLTENAPHSNACSLADARTQFGGSPGVDFHLSHGPIRRLMPAFVDWLRFQRDTSEPTADSKVGVGKAARSWFEGQGGGWGGSRETCGFGVSIPQSVQFCTEWMGESMCGRFTLAAAPKLVAELFDLDVDDLPLFEPRYNIAPTQPVVALRLDGSGLREAVELKWGLIPSWAKDASIGSRLINARAESVTEKPSFRSAMKKRRCLVAADGYYEWTAVGKLKQPYYITLNEGKPFAIAGLYEHWRDSNGRTIETCSLLTTEANASISPLHDRMPVIVPKPEFDRWLDAETYSVEDVADLLLGIDDPLKFRPVSTYVNNARNEGVQCVASVSSDEQPDTPSDHLFDSLSD